MLCESSWQDNGTIEFMDITEQIIPFFLQLLSSSIIFCQGEGKKINENSDSVSSQLLV